MNKFEFTSDIQRALFMDHVCDLCAAQDCNVKIIDNELVFPEGCDKICGCYQRVMDIALKKVGAYKNATNS